MSKAKNIPALRFPEFGGEWEEKRVGNICSMRAGKFISASEIHDQYEDGLYPCYGGNGLRGYTRTYTNTGKYPLIGRQGALCGNIKLAVGLFYATEHAVVVTAKKDIQVEWLFYQLGRLNLNQYATGQAQPGLSVEVLEKVASITPAQPQEQQKIANFLTAVDEKLQGLKKKKALLEQYKKGVMQKIFSQELRFKDENGNDFADWEMKKLGDIGEIYQPQTISQTDLTESGFDVYGANGIIGKYSKFNHEHSQIVVTCRGNTCGTINFTNPKSWITGNAMVVNLDAATTVSKKFIFYQLVNTNFSYLITGSGQPQITGEIKKHFMKLPSSPEQAKIANLLNAIDEKINQQQNQIEKASHYKKGLLQQMFC